MQIVIGTIDPRHPLIVAAMIESTGELLPKTAAAKAGKPLVVLETRPARMVWAVKCR